MSGDNIEFIDESQPGSGYNQGLSFRDIVMNQIRQIVKNANVELRGGLYEAKPVVSIQSGVMVNSSIDIYVENRREIYSNSVEILWHLLQPWADEILLSKANAILTRIKQNGTIFEEEILIENQKTGLKAILNLELREQYSQQRLILMQNLFSEIMIFLKKINYLQAAAFED